MNIALYAECSVRLTDDSPVLAFLCETGHEKNDPCFCSGLPRQVVALNRQIMGDKHPGVADSLSDLAELLRAQGKLDEVHSCVRHVCD